jgi:hypothetical protein
MNPMIILIGVVVVAVIVMVVVWRMMRSRSLTSAAQKKLLMQFESAKNQPDLHRRILDGENVVDLALRSLGYQGSFGDKLKKAGPRFSDVQGLWNAHKLRNRIAHEAGVQISAADADRAMYVFERALKDLC